MKMMIATLITVFLLNIEAMAADASQVWLARQTGNVSCSENRYDALPEVVKDAKKIGLKVVNANVGYFKGYAYCMACGCTEGSYYLVKVEEKEGIDNLLVGQDFKKVDEKDLIFKK